MSEAKDNTLALSVRLKPVEHSTQPHAANYTHVGVAQGIVYLDFGFIEPALLGAVLKKANEGQPGPQAIEGQLVARVAIGLDVLARLHEQIQQILSLRAARQMKSKS